MVGRTVGIEGYQVQMRIVHAYNSGNADTAVVSALVGVDGKEAAYMTPSENMHVSVRRWRSDTWTLRRFFAGQRKIRKSLNVFCDPWK